MTNFMWNIFVIVPAYNVEAYLSRCIDSILSQTYKNFRLILIDDGSKDKSGEICDSYAVNDERISVVHQKNAGLSAARNVGIEIALSNADCQWITFVDSDDWVHPKYLEFMLNAALSTQTRISCSSFIRTKGESLPEQSSTSEFQIVYPADYFRTSGLPTTVAWAKLYNIECFKDIRFPAGKTHEDEFIIYKVLFREEKIAFVNQPLYAYYQNDNGIMRRPWFPGRIDATEALEQQVSFILKLGYTEIAERRFSLLIKRILWNQEQVAGADGLHKCEKEEYTNILIKRLRRVLLKYWKYGWFPFQKNKKTYLMVFPEIKMLRDFWSVVKRLLNRISGNVGLGDMISGMWKK